MGGSGPAVLLLIDLQKAIEHPSWGDRNNPGAEDNIATLLARWRQAKAPVWHVAHDSTDPMSHYRPGSEGNAFRVGFEPLPNEPVFRKRTHSAFIGTDLADRLHAIGDPALFVAGVITNNSVEATVRMGGNLGFQISLVADACYTFGRTDWNGKPVPAEDVHALSLANMENEYCAVVTTADAAP